MIHRKEFVACVCITMILGRVVLPLIQYGPVLDDPEFDQAIAWGTKNSFAMMGETLEYPFGVVTRLESVQWYLQLMKEVGATPLRETCSFSDIGDLEKSVQDSIIESCTYNVFLGDGGNFNPDSYLTKATALVALMRSIRPEVEHPMESVYRTPYVTDAYDLGITKRPSSEYLEYPVTRYELIVMLWRAERECRMQNAECGKE